MKKIKGPVVFSVLFLLLCALPALGLLWRGPSRPAANEVLAPKPALRAGAGWNLDCLSDLSAWFGDRFAYRQELVTANAALTAALFGESASESVILGRDGWLYYADTLDDYEGAAPMSERELWRAARTLSLAQEYARERGARFLFTAAPNKNTLYPAQMPARYPAARGASNWERLMPALDRAGVAYCDLREALSSAAEPVYYRTDSHWDGCGSALACDALIAALGGESALADERFTTAPHRGDLYEMLYPAGKGTEAGRVLDRARTFSYLGNFRAADDLTIRTGSGGTMGRLLMFRDSFGNSLHADLAEAFSGATFSRANPIRLDMLDGEGTVLFELVERNLPTLLTAAPVMPSPRRTLDEPVGAAAAAVEWEQKPSEELPGLVCYTGTIRCGEMDADSPVYVRLDGALYEAAPAGRGEEAFTLYAPAAREMEVLIRCGGVWRRCEQPDGGGEKPV